MIPKPSIALSVWFLVLASAVAADVQATPPACRLGSDARQVCGYACRLGSDGRVVCADTEDM